MMGWMSQLSGENENDYIEVHKKHYNDLIEKSKELKIYKEALKMACEDIKSERCNACRLVEDCFECKYSYEYVEEYLQKARGEV